MDDDISARARLDDFPHAIAVELAPLSDADLTRWMSNFDDFTRAKAEKMLAEIDAGGGARRRDVGSLPPINGEGPDPRRFDQWIRDSFRR